MTAELQDTPLRVLWRALTRFDSRKIVPAIAVRNTIGFIFAMVLGTVFASPSTGVVAGLGALNACYSDTTDPYRVRARRMLMATGLSGIGVVAGAISAHTNAAAIAVATLWAFGAGMLVALGTTAADLGVISLVTVVIFAAKPLPAVQAVEAGMVAMGGGLIQTLLSTFLWPVRRYEPERRIIARIYDELASIATAPSTQAPPLTAQISEAQEALAPLAREHSVEAERHTFLLVQAERIRLSLLNTGRLHRRLGRHAAGAAASASLGQILDAASAVIRLIAQRIAASNSVGLDSALAQLTAALVNFQTCSGTGGDAFFSALLRDARRQSGALRSQLRSAAWAAQGTINAEPNSAAARAEAAQPWRMRLQGHRARLLANLSLDSTVFRHALRLAVCLGIGDLIGRTLVLQRTYWIPMTIAIVLKPDFTGTFARGALRIGGTLAGLALATVLFHFVHSGFATDIVLMALFTLALRWAGPANYGIFVVAMSSLVVLLIAVTGVAPADVIAPRALNTVLGGSLALLAYAAWPTWERTQTGAALAEMLDAYRAYSAAVLAAMQGAGTEQIDTVRLSGRRARSNALASVERMAGEPGGGAARAAALDAILTHSHSFVHAVMAMESRLYVRRGEQIAPAWLPAFAASVDHALQELAATLRNPETATNRRSRLDVATPAPGEGGNELLETEADRVRTSLRSLSEELARRDWI